MASAPAGTDLARPAGGPAPVDGGGILDGGRIAARIAADRVELWVPGALAAVAFAGWIPFVLAIATLPSVGDLGFFGASIAISPTFPWNVIALAAATALALVAASVSVAAGEAALQRGVDRAIERPDRPRSLDDEAARLWLVQVVAALPAVATLVASALAISAVAQGEYQSPDIGGPFVVRVARRRLAARWRRPASSPSWGRRSVPSPSAPCGGARRDRSPGRWPSAPSTWCITRCVASAWRSPATSPWRPGWRSSGPCCICSGRPSDGPPGKGSSWRPAARCCW